MASELSGKVIVVMGGTSGLGLSAVRACVRQGARVVAVGRDAAKADALASGRTKAALSHKLRQNVQPPQRQVLQGQKCRKFGLNRAVI